MENEEYKIGSTKEILFRTLYVLLLVPLSLMQAAWMISLGIVFALVVVPICSLIFGMIMYILYGRDWDYIMSKKYKEYYCWRDFTTFMMWSVYLWPYILLDYLRNP